MSETRILALVGDPVSHSLSPRMQNAAIGAAGIDATYIALRTKKTALAALITELLRAGGACNITSPFKDDAFALPGVHSDVAKRTRSVNCVFGRSEEPHLDNTDVAGVAQAAAALLEDDDPGLVRIYGTGGSARSAAVAVAEQWPGARMQVVSRDEGRAAAFLSWAAGAAVSCGPNDPASEADLAIWARPPAASEEDMSGESVPRAFLDLNYRAGGTPLTVAHAARRVPAADGREVLLGQGAAAFERFFGIPAPVGVMRAAVEYALRT